MGGTFIGFNKATNPAGNNGEIQFNDNGAFGASSRLVFDNLNNRLSLLADQYILQRLYFGAATPENERRINILDVNDFEQSVHVWNDNMSNVSDGIFIRKRGDGHALRIITDSNFRGIPLVITNSSSSNNKKPAIIINTFNGSPNVALSVVSGTINFGNNVDFIQSGNNQTNKFRTQLNGNFIFETTAQTPTLVINNSAQIGVGTATPQARLDIRAQGALSTDIALRVRNSANNGNHLLVRGSGLTNIIGALNIGTETNDTSHRLVINTGASTAQSFLSCENNLGVKFRVSNINVAIGGNTLSTASNVLSIFKGTAPTSGQNGSFALYSADITAGNAAPHFRTENGDVIKLYAEQNVAVGYNANTGDANTDAMIDLMMTHLKNLGLLKEI